MLLRESHRRSFLERLLYDLSSRTRRKLKKMYEKVIFYQYITWSTDSHTSLVLSFQRVGNQRNRKDNMATAASRRSSAETNDLKQCFRGS